MASVGGMVARVGSEPGRDKLQRGQRFVEDTTWSLAIRSGSDGRFSRDPTIRARLRWSAVLGESTVGRLRPARVLRRGPLGDRTLTLALVEIDGHRRHVFVACGEGRGRTEGSRLRSGSCLRQPEIVKEHVFVACDGGREREASADQTRSGEVFGKRRQLTVLALEAAGAVGVCGAERLALR